MLRVPIGGTDFSSRSYTLDDVPYDENLESFSLAEEDFKLRVGIYGYTVYCARRISNLYRIVMLLKSHQTISTNGTDFKVRFVLHNKVIP